MEAWPQESTSHFVFLSPGILSAGEGIYVHDVASFLTALTAYKARSRPVLQMPMNFAQNNFVFNKYCLFVLRETVMGQVNDVDGTLARTVRIKPRKNAIAGVLSQAYNFGYPLQD